MHANRTVAYAVRTRNHRIVRFWPRHPGFHHAPRIDITRPSEAVSLADHLSAVHRNVEAILRVPPQEEYVEVLHAALAAFDLDIGLLRNILSPVALLHHIGKPLEDKTAEIPHPLTGKSVKK